MAMNGRRATSEDNVIIDKEVRVRNWGGEDNRMNVKYSVVVIGN